MDRSSSQTSFRSRRSYPSLSHISVAPLTPRFPIDDDGEPQDYFSPRAETIDTPTRTSYLSSYSVPGTPGVLSQSRSGSRVRHHTRSKSSTRVHLSDSNLQEQNVDQPLHHHHHHHHQNQNQNHHPLGRNSKTPHPPTSDPRDSEWLLRAGIALASSAREEKGQSWLVKRESSTSLVSDAHSNKYDLEGSALSRVTTRRSRSGRSTPAVYSRRGSRSRVTSRRNSRPDLTMTSLEMTSSNNSKQIRTSTDDEARSLVPDFVDERIRAEMRNIQRDGQNEYDDGATPLSEEDWDYSEDGEDDEGEVIDEYELQRLTRERGFGLGGWVDRMVEWTLFGVDDWPLSSTATAGSLDYGGTTNPVGSITEARSTISEHEDGQSVSAFSDHGDGDSISDTNSEAPAVIEKAGEKGGWEDAGWLLRTMRRAFF